MHLSWSHKLFLKINAQVGKRPWLDAFMIFCAKRLIFILVFIAIVDRWAVGFLGVLIFISLVISWLIAWFWRHPRPIVEIPETKELITPLSHWKTFPSDHTLVAFSILFSGGSLVIVVVNLVFACLIAMSRVYVGVHYPRDIVGGVLLAVFIYVGFLIVTWLGLLLSPTM